MIDGNVFDFSSPYTLSVPLLNISDFVSVSYDFGHEFWLHMIPGAPSTRLIKIANNFEYFFDRSIDDFGSRDGEFGHRNF